MPRSRNPLVCQYIENLSSGALEEYSEIIRDLVARRHGVYALYRRDKLYYVGLAINLRNRLKAHLKDKHKGLWDRFSVYLTIDDSHMKELESLLLRIAMPKGNSQKGKFAKAENLTRTLRQRVRKRQREDWLKLIGKEIDLITRETSGKRSRRPKGEEVVLAGIFERTVTLRARYKRKDFRARVGRNGVIRFNGKFYNSPSSAGAAVRGRATNGWWLWKYERAPGQWVRLRELRNR